MLCWRVCTREYLSGLKRLKLDVIRNENERWCCNHVDGYGDGGAESVCRTKPGIVCVAWYIAWVGVVSLG